jgi:hypothetical protein
MSGAIEFAQARMQARHGKRPDAGSWATLHAAITLATLLDNARASSLEPWIAGLDAGCTQDELELLLRERLRGRIAEVAGWMPDAWRPAVLWTRVLLDLPAMQYIARGGAPRRWMRADPAVSPRLADPADEERALHARHLWVEAWRTLWPHGSAEQRAALEELAATVETHLLAFQQAAPDDAASLRTQLQGRLETLFRRDALTPAAAFEHLALLALDAERLRSELVTRAMQRAQAAP